MVSTRVTESGKIFLISKRYVRENGGIKWKNLQQNNDGREKYREVVRLGC